MRLIGPQRDEISPKVGRRPSHTLSTLATRSLGPEDIFAAKIAVCSKPASCIPTDESSMQFYLAEIVEALEKVDSLQELVVPNLEGLLKMVEENLFRPLQKLVMVKAPTEMVSKWKSEEFVDPNWPSLRPIYTIMQSILEFKVLDQAKIKEWLRSNIHRLVDRFEVNNPLERIQLQATLLTVHKRFSKFRPILIACITEALTTLSSEGVRLAGAAELLEICTILLAGQSQLSAAQIDFFESVVLPLFKVQTCHLFHRELTSCCQTYWDHVPHLAKGVVETLLRVWPAYCSDKEIFFIKQLSLSLNALEASRLLGDHHIERGFERLARCLSSLNFKVSDATIALFEQEETIALCTKYDTRIYPYIVPVAMQQSASYWHLIIRESMTGLVNNLKNINGELFEKVLKSLKSQSGEPTSSTLWAEYRPNDLIWKELEARASAQRPYIHIEQLPYTREAPIAAIREDLEFAVPQE